MKTKYFRKPIFLVVVGILLMSLSAGWRLYQLRVLSFFGNNDLGNNVQVVSKNLPIAIRISFLNLSLPVVETTIVNGVWEIPEKSAGHLNTSSGIGSGNMVVYAHNKNSLFGPIRWIKTESVIEIVGHDEKTYRYQVVEIKEVGPDKIEYVLPKNEEVLTLYTCSGIFDSKRLVVVAKRI